jgi:hypothetical protein
VRQRKVKAAGAGARELRFQALVDFGDAGVNLGDLLAGALVVGSAPIGRKGQCGAELLVCSLPSGLQILPLAHMRGQGRTS